jgi:type I restriction enzyme R subunit
MVMQRCRKSALAVVAFARLLPTKLPKREGGSLIDLDDDVTLTYYRMDKTFEGSVALPVGEQQIIRGASDVGTGKPNEENLSPLSTVIDAINKRFGTNFAEGDRLLMVPALEDLSADATLETQAKTNTLDNFRHAFEPAAIDAILNRNQRNGEITEQFMGNPELRRMMLDAMVLDYYQRVRRSEAGGH